MADDRLISLNAALDAFKKELTTGEPKGNYVTICSAVSYVGAKQILEGLPSAQPETAKRIVGKSRDGMTLWYQCDMCNEPVDAQDNFCRGCGRRLTDG